MIYISVVSNSFSLDLVLINPIQLNNSSYIEASVQVSV